MAGVWAGHLDKGKNQRPNRISVHEIGRGGISLRWIALQKAKPHFATLSLAYCWVFQLYLLILREVSVIIKQSNLIGVILTLKKLLCLGVALILTVSLAACGKKLTPAQAYQLYNQAIQTVNTSTGLDLGVSTAITLAQDSLADYTTYNTSLQKQQIDGSLKLDALFTMTQQGQNSENEYSIDGNTAYVISQGQYKEVDLSLVEKYTAHCQMYPIPEDAVTKVSTGKKEGNPAYTLTIDPAKADELVKSHLNNYQMSTDSVELEIKDVSIILMTNKNGEVDQIQLSYLLNATLSESGTTQELSASTVYKIVKSGESVVVNMPDFSSLTPAQEDEEGSGT